MTCLKSQYEIPSIEPIFSSALATVGEEFAEVLDYVMYIEYCEKSEIKAGFLLFTVIHFSNGFTRV